jgi:predicted TIM-barrel fold metal-dependent hydrolase
MSDLVVDADGHVTEPPTLWDQYLEPRFRDRAPRFTLDAEGRPCQIADGRHIMRHAMRLTLPPGYPETAYVPRAGGFDPHERLRDLDSEGIDVAVLFPSVGLYVSDVTEPTLLAALCRAYNDWLADYCRADPSRLVGIALLPLADVPAAIRELERTTAAYGFRGAFCRPNPYAGRPIHHPDYEPFWACAASLGVPVTVHEGISDWVPTLGRDRFDNPAMLHVLSHPFEQMAACAGLILSGVLERHPRLTVAFLESGAAWLPYWLHRLDEHCETWGHHLPGLRLKPSEYFRRQCVVSTEPGEEAVDAVVAHVGEDYVVWASDYPHPDATFPGAVTRSLEAMTGLTATARQKIFGANAVRLYGLETTRPPRR